jgi:hypothetical protein
MRVVVLSDTHVPTRVPTLSGWVRDAVAGADHAIHAGDFDSVETLSTVRDLADGNLTAVRGNVDDPGVELPAVATVELGGVAFVVTHGHGGPAATYRRRLADVVREHAGPDGVGVGGHIHEYLDEVHGEVRLLNPGSATGANPGDEPSLMRLDVADGALSVTKVTP